MGENVQLFAAKLVETHFHFVLEQLSAYFCADSSCTAQNDERFQLKHTREIIGKTNQKRLTLSSISALNENDTSFHEFIEFIPIAVDRKDVKSIPAIESSR